MRLSLPRLYAILDVDSASLHGLAPLQLLDTWLDAGIRLVQLRAKNMASGPFLALAEAVADRARTAQSTCIINDRADIAVLAGASGVHVGQDDLAPADVRRIVGDSAVVGLSTHASAQVRQGVSQPIDYLAIGPVFATATKERPDPVVGLDGVRVAAEIAARHALPVVAIGGITRATAPTVLAAGAASVVVVADLLGSDPAARAREWVRLLT